MHFAPMLAQWLPQVGKGIVVQCTTYHLDSRPFGFAQGRLCAGMTRGWKTRASPRIRRAGFAQWCQPLLSEEYY
jgi:hypothetical protein